MGLLCVACGSVGGASFRSELCGTAEGEEKEGLTQEALGLSACYLLFLYFPLCTSYHVTSAIEKQAIKVKNKANEICDGFHGL